MENQEAILTIMKRFFEEDSLMGRDDFYVLTGIETRPEKLNPVPENTDD